MWCRNRLASISNTSPPARSRHARSTHGAAMIVARRARCRARRSRDEAVIADEVARRRASSSVAIERRARRPLGAAPERRRGFVVSSHVVAVAAASRAVARVELGAHLVRRRDPDIVAAAVRSVRVASSRRTTVRALAHRPPGRAHARRRRSGPRQEPRRDCRRGASSAASSSPCTVRSFGLTLPTREGGAVVVQHELHGARRHRSETSPTRGTCQATDTASRECAEAIDFARRTRSTFRSAVQATSRAAPTALPTVNVSADIFPRSPTP